MLGLVFAIMMHITVAFGQASEPVAEELRGIWVTRWTYASAEDVKRIMNEVADAGFNTVYFQVRGQHDAFYKSDIEPWSDGLTGTLGKDPGWDPLAVAVEAGHARKLHVHAYINSFTVWRGQEPPQASVPPHAWHTDGDWLVATADGMPSSLNEGYVYASPGQASVRKRLASVAKDIADRYPVDGIHLDHIRYPGPEFGHDLGSLAAWEADGQPDFGDWRRAQVNKAVADVQAAVDVPVSAAVWGVYTNRWGWPEVSEGRNAYFQDADAFTREGLVDALLPMVYWPVNPGGRLDFTTLIEDHVSRANGRHVYAGIRTDPSWGSEAVIACIKAARKAGAHGVVLFEYSEGKPYFDALKADVFNAPANPPKMDWR
jgi:uncharacterized lipoprotein YddW (UPF0748 family)